MAEYIIIRNIDSKNPIQEPSIEVDDKIVDEFYKDVIKKSHFNSNKGE